MDPCLSKPHSNSKMIHKDIPEKLVENCAQKTKQLFLSCFNLVLEEAETNPKSQNRENSADESS